MSDLFQRYLIDAKGNPRAVVIPIELWQQIFPDGASAEEALVDGIEDYC